MKVVTMYEDANGTAHRTEGAALKADAIIVYERAVDKCTSQGDFDANEFLKEMQTDADLREKLLFLLEAHDEKGK